MRFLLFAVVLSSLVATSAASADDAARSSARVEFLAGTELAQSMRWGEALGRFEASARLHPHPGTTYNIGVCHRALGHFTRADRAFKRALAQHEPNTDAALPDHMLADTRAFLDEIARLLARIEVVLTPAGGRVSLDGRPLAPTGNDRGRPVLTAGIEPPGAGRSAPAQRFVIIADPGTHVLLIARKGYADVVRRIDLAPGARDKLSLELERLPGKLAISANQPGAVVSVDGLDVGIAPVVLERPAGPHRVIVRKPSFVTYSTTATLSAGERTALDAELEKEPVALTERWWFWAGLGAAVVGIGVGTYFATRPEPERPEVPRGNLGWAVEVP